MGPCFQGKWGFGMSWVLREFSPDSLPKNKPPCQPGWGREMQEMWHWGFLERGQSMPRTQEGQDSLEGWGRNQVLDPGIEVTVSPLSFSIEKNAAPFLQEDRRGDTIKVGLT